MSQNSSHRLDLEFSSDTTSSGANPSRIWKCEDEDALTIQLCEVHNNFLYPTASTYVFNDTVVKPLPFFLVMYVIFVVKLSSIGTKRPIEFGLGVSECLSRRLLACEARNVVERCAREESSDRIVEQGSCVAHCKRFLCNPTEEAGWTTVY
jgi:hypothetical protein